MGIVVSVCCVFILYPYHLVVLRVCVCAEMGSLLLQSN